jgi:hypothetical protein
MISDNAMLLAPNENLSTRVIDSQVPLYCYTLMLLSFRLFFRTDAHR